MGKLILGIETSSNICSVSLFNNNENIGVIEELIDRKHAEVLPDYIEILLKNSKKKIINIDAIAVSIGPGSFTGLRVGLSFAKGIAYAIKCSIIPVPSILSLAFSLKDKKPINGIIRSHGDKVFFQEFIWDKGFPRVKSKPELGNIDNYHDRIKNGFQWNCETILKNKNNIYSVVPSAKHIGSLAYVFYDDWNIPKPYNLISEYIYPFQIQSRGK